MGGCKERQMREIGKKRKREKGNSRSTRAPETHKTDTICNLNILRSGTKNRNHWERIVLCIKYATPSSLSAKPPSSIHASWPRYALDFFLFLGISSRCRDPQLGCKPGTSLLFFSLLYRKPVVLPIIASTVSIALAGPRLRVSSCIRAVGQRKALEKSRRCTKRAGLALAWCLATCNLMVLRCSRCLSGRGVLAYQCRPTAATCGSVTRDLIKRQAGLAGFEGIYSLVFPCFIVRWTEGLVFV
jgi:hypothetical protein